MSQQLINRSPDLKKLRDEGFDVYIKAGHLFMRHVPYVNSDGKVLYGTLVSELSMAGNRTIPPTDHTVKFIGELPCNKHGKPFGDKLVNQHGPIPIAEGITAHFSFSSKPKADSADGRYPDYFAKMSTYAKILESPAKAVDPTITAKPFNPVNDGEDDSPFHYIDTASSRAETTAVSEKLRMENVAMIGAGGNGAYLLDFVAKTPVRHIHIFDGDWFYQHNAFRSPGAPSLAELEQKLKKVDYLASIYSKMHRGIISHPYHVTPENIEELRNMDFVFLCLDDPEAKKYIIDMLFDFGIPFIDTGMGLYLNDGKIGGLVRTTSCTDAKKDHIAARIPFGKTDGINEYSANIQIADLNALNALMAVIRWKKFAGFYHDFDHEHFSVYVIDGNIITNDDKS